MDGHGGAPDAGTTIIAAVYKDGVVVCSDGRVTVGTYVSNRSSNKITALTDNVYLLRSGSAPDAQAVSDYVRYSCHQLEAESGEGLPVATVASLVRQMNYQNKDMLVGALIIAGWDEQAGGQVYGCPIGGTLQQLDWACEGSGSTFIWGYMDAHWRADFTREECEAYVREAAALAMARDAGSGGCIRTVVVSRTGAEHSYIAGNQVPVFQDDMRPQPAMVLG